MNSEIFFNLSNKKISIIIFDKDSKKEISNKIFNLSNLSTNNMSIEDGINHVLKNQIIYIEEIINTSINSINLMLEEKNSLSIKASVKKDYDKNPIQKKQIEYLIQDLKQQILKNNSDLKILHIIVDNFIVDEQHFDVIPLVSSSYDPNSSHPSNTAFEFLNLTDGHESSYWEFGNGGISIEESPIYDFMMPGTYHTTLTATSEHGCVSSHTEVVIISNELEIYVPNSFTPPFDGTNSTPTPPAAVT